MSRLLDVTVPGVPRPQGSMRLLGAVNGQPRLRYSDTTIEHRNMAVVTLRDEWSGRDTLAEAVAVRCTFEFPRPRSHYGTGRNASTLKPSAPRWHGSTPDTDKLLRLVGDSLVLAGVLRDDSQITVMRGEKVWSDAGTTRIEVFAL